MQYEYYYEYYDDLFTGRCYVWSIHRLSIARSKYHEKIRFHACTGFRYLSEIVFFCSSSFFSNPKPLCHPLLTLPIKTNTKIEFFLHYVGLDVLVGVAVFNLWFYANRWCKFSLTCSVGGTQLSAPKNRFKHN